jgi:hypothetical protein
MPLAVIEGNRSVPVILCDICHGKIANKSGIYAWVPVGYPKRQVCRIYFVHPGNCFYQLEKAHPEGHVHFLHVPELFAYLRRGLRFSWKEADLRANLMGSI